MFNGWKSGDFLVDTPRFGYCLLLDARSVRSILASTEARKPGMIGYVNVVGCDFEYNPDDPNNECSEYYNGAISPESV